MDQTKNEHSVKQNPIVRLFLRHYGNTTCTISQEQYDREKFLFSKVKFNPWILMPAAVIVQFCVGSVYAWSVFNAPIDDAISGDIKISQAPVTFYIAFGMLGFTAALMGPWLERNGPKKALIVSSTAFYIGNLLSALAIYLKYIWLLYFGYGFIGGFGIGLSYITPVAILQKWFPHRRGLAAGVGVCGFGAGSIAVGKIILPIIRLVGLPLTFVVLGSSFFVAMICSALIFRVPEPNHFTKCVTDDKTDESETNATYSSQIKLTLKESLQSVDYFLLYITFFSNILFGLLVISRFSDMITKLFGMASNEASNLVAVNGIFNLFGRLFFSTLSDKIGRKPCFLILLITQMVIIGTFPYYVEHKIYWVFVLSMIVLSTCYGGGFGVLPAFLNDMFGSHNISVCYGLILTAWSFAAIVGGFVFTTVYNYLVATGSGELSDPHPYIINSYWILGFVTIGVIATSLVKSDLKDRLLPPFAGQWLRYRLFRNVIVIKRSGCCPQIEIISAKTYDEMWEEYCKHRHHSPSTKLDAELTCAI
ncbi:putative MFS-type transporter YhjX [Pseudolycoriella hygida]|uniref:MFS-type transporter YhjX n=1 Tax=Pseudolycoriella hygida TaxID=35572 RepID=A0A9Q0MSG7_9DIPT|nr:putative MFS-type transporter YhjX [Pseudolycoriella hygida]